MFFFFFLFAATLNRACFLFSSQSQALAHYKGTKHAKKLKALDAPKTKLKASVVTKETANQEIAKGINTSPVPNGTDRKGLCVPACCTFSDTCFFVVFSLCSCSSVGKRALDPANAPFLSCFFSPFDLLHAYMQSLQELDGLAVDYINPVLGCSGQMGRLPALRSHIEFVEFGRSLQDTGRHKRDEAGPQHASNKVLVGSTRLRLAPFEKSVSLVHLNGTTSSVQRGGQQGGLWQKKIKMKGCCQANLR